MRRNRWDMGIGVFAPPNRVGIVVLSSKVQPSGGDVIMEKSNAARLEMGHGASRGRSS